MRKHKDFSDTEYLIERVECDEGVDREHFVWICSTVNKKGKKIEFNVKPMGTREQKWEWYDNFMEHVGKMLTVRYQDLTTDGIPRFPRGVSMRDYE